MSVEELKAFFDAATVVLLFLTFVAGAGVLVTGNVINKRQAAQLREFETNITVAKTELGKQEVRVAAADTRVAELERSAFEAKADQQRVEIELNVQKAKAASAEGDLIRLKEQIKWRTITPDQKVALVNGLKKNSGGPISIEYPADDPEALAFAKQLEDIFTEAGWPRIKGGKPQAMLGISNIGQGITVHQLESAPRYARYVQDVFNAAGIPLWGFASDRRAKDEVVVSVGHKKPPKP